MICIQHLAVEPDAKSKTFWEKVMTDFNEKTTTKWPRSVVQAKLRKVEEAWKKILEGGGPRNPWLFEGEMKLLNAVKNKKSDAYSDALDEGSQQGNSLTASIISIFLHLGHVALALCKICAH